MMAVATDDLLARVRAGDQAACARLMSLAERGHPRFAAAYAEFHPELGRAHRIGITGPPGAGKSTLVEGLGLHWRGQGRTLGVVAVDPSSPFSGGALLGDRVRMSRLALDAGVFIRSMATRGVFGGLARATDDVADVLDVFGIDTVLVETVGVGQAEVDIARSCDFTVVVLHPGGGDTIQAMKAGLMEVADLYLVNKADLPGADRMMDELAETLHLVDDGAGRDIPILSCVAASGEGVGELAARIDAMLAEHASNGVLQARRRENLVRRVRRLVNERMKHDIWEEQGLSARLAARVESGAAKSAYGLAGEILAAVGGPRPSETEP